MDYLLNFVTIEHRKWSSCVQPLQPSSLVLTEVKNNISNQSPTNRPARNDSLSLRTKRKRITANARSTRKRSCPANKTMNIENYLIPFVT